VSDTPGAEPPHIRGNPNAPVTVEEFADFQCPSCGAYYPELKKIEGEFGDRLRVIFRERPLVPPHEHALMAAHAAEAAGLQGRFGRCTTSCTRTSTTWSLKANSDSSVCRLRQTDRAGHRPSAWKDINGEAVHAHLPGRQARFML
jgi:hypothetical protein